MWIKIFLIILSVTLFIPNVTAFQDWTNITCIDGNAHKFWNSTTSTGDYNRSDVEICHDLNCIDGIGCIDPRETPGEVFFANVLIFILGAFLFGYLAIKITDKKHYPIRMVFFFMSIILIMSSALMGFSTTYVFGLYNLASPVFYSYVGIFIVFLLILFYFLKEIIQWAVFEMQKAMGKKQPEAENINVP